MRPLRPVLTLGLSIVALTAGTGCDLLQQLYSEPVELGIDLASPPIEVNVTEQVEEAEAEVCADNDAQKCTVMKGLDRSDDGEVSSPPSVPPEFPIEIPIEDDEGNPVPNPENCDEPNPLDCPQLVINVEDWAEEQGLFDDVDFKTAVPVDISEQLEVSGPGAIEGVRIDSVGINWIDNSLTFSTVELDLYMTLDYLEDANADDLLEDGEVTYIGTLDRQQAETDGVTPIQFIDDDAKQLFTDGLLNLRFTLVTALPPDTKLELAEGSEPNTRKKPLGIVDLSLVGRIIYTVTPSELVGDTKAAYERGDFNL